MGRGKTTEGAHAGLYRRMRVSKTCAADAGAVSGKSTSASLEKKLKSYQVVDASPPFQLPANGAPPQCLRRPADANFSYALHRLLSHRGRGSADPSRPGRGRRKPFRT